MKQFQIRAVSFDVGGTLIDPWPSVGHVYAAVACDAGFPALEPDLLNVRFNNTWRGKTNFNYSRLAWAQLVETTFGSLLPDARVPAHLFERLYERFAEAAVWRIHEDVTATLSALQESGLKLAVISNWDERLRPLLRNLKLESFFDTIEVSAESGFHKPSPEIFHRAVRSLGLSPGQVLHVGDSVVADFRGAREAGLLSVLLRRGTAGQEPEEISTLGSLLARVGS